MHYTYRAGLEWMLTRRGRERWRFIGEQCHVSWTIEKYSRWYRTREKAEAAANRWLDRHEYHHPDLEPV